MASLTCTVTGKPNEASCSLPVHHRFKKGENSLLDVLQSVESLLDMADQDLFLQRSPPKLMKRFLFAKGFFPNFALY